jgi:hypothetical protein
LIDAIRLLFEQFCPLDPNYEFLTLITKQTNSDYNLNIWRQLHNVPEEHSIHIKWMDIFLLLHVILEEFPFMVCKFLPLQLNKQIHGIAMGTNCAV